MISRNERVEWSNGHFILETEIQGQDRHGTKPPLEALHRLVAGWLSDNFSDFANPATRRQSTGAPGRQHYLLQIECARIDAFSRHFAGVHVVAPSPYCGKVLLVRMRLSGQPCQWKGELVCPNAKIAEAAIRHFCPKAYAFVKGYVDQQVSQLKQSVNGPPDLARARACSIYNRIRHAEKGVRRLYKRGALRRLSHLLIQSGAVPGEKLPERLLRETLKTIFISRHDLAYEEARFILVRVGLLQPVGEKLNAFVLDPLSEEYADDYLRREEERKREQRADRLRRLKSAQKSALQEAGKLLMRSIAKKELASQLEAQITALEAGMEIDLIAALPRPISGNGKKK